MEMQDLQDAVVALRNIRAEMKIDPKQKLPGELSSEDSGVLKVFTKYRNNIIRLANVSELSVSDGRLQAEGHVVRHEPRFDAGIPFAADPVAEIKRLRKQKEKIEREMEKVRTRLADKEFRQKAPLDVIQGLEFRQAEYNTQYQKVSTLLSQLESRLASGETQP